MNILDSCVLAIIIVGVFLVVGVPQAFWLRSNTIRKCRIPLDAGKTFRGRRIFGENKTLGGLVVMVPGITLAFGMTGLALAYWAPEWLEIIGWPVRSEEWLLLGFVTSCCYMLGELPNSFVKRQWGVPAGGIPDHRLGRLLCFVADQVDSVFAFMLALVFLVPTSWTLFGFIFVFGAVAHWLYNVVLFKMGLKSRAG